jgi:hypothetical protein
MNPEVLGSETEINAITPKANYTDWSTATGRRILLPSFADRGVSRGQRGGIRWQLNLVF